MLIHQLGCEGGAIEQEKDVDQDIESSDGCPKNPAQDPELLKEMQLLEQTLIDAEHREPLSADEKMGASVHSLEQFPVSPSK